MKTKYPTVLKGKVTKVHLLDINSSIRLVYFQITYAIIICIVGLKDYSDMKLTLTMLIQVINNAMLLLLIM